MGQRIAVIGGSGFIGSHIADALVEAKHTVSLIDAKESQWAQSTQSMHVADILNKEELVRVFLQSKTEVVYHMAGISDIDECHKNPLQAVKYNILGTACVLEACLDAGVKKIVYASSAYVSSDKGSFYRITKQSSENLIEEYSLKSGLEYVILRYGTLYGPRSDSRNQIHRLITGALTKKKIEYKGLGTEKREFIHVLDAARLSVRVLENEFKNQKILITGSQSVRYKELLEMLNEMLGDEIKISYTPTKNKTHYNLSPYSFKPEIVRKLVGDYHVEFGQGLLSLIQEIHDYRDAA